MIRVVTQGNTETLGARRTVAVAIVNLDNSSENRYDEMMNKHEMSTLYEVFR